MARRHSAGDGRSNGRSNGGSNGKSRGTGRSGDAMHRQHRGVGSAAAARGGRGTLVIIGGREDKEGDKLILTDVARRVGSGKLVVATVASEVQGELFEEYERLFRALGVRHVFKLEIASRADAFSERAIRVLDDAVAVFFTGGDQLRITSQLGDSPIYDRIREIYQGGGLVVGTSAGASVMSETMMVAGSGDESYRIGSKLHMAPGFGLLQDVVVDQHFAERGRIGRLLGAVAQNPRMLGVGIDENTAIVVHDARSFEVIGDGAVYVLDASGVTYSNLTEEEQDRTLSLFGVQVHVLSMGDSFDIGLREPDAHPADSVLERLGVGSAGDEE
jgi:cyanophycinase